MPRFAIEQQVAENLKPPPKMTTWVQPNLAPRANPIEVWRRMANVIGEGEVIDEAEAEARLTKLTGERSVSGFYNGTTNRICQLVSSYGYWHWKDWKQGLLERNTPPPPPPVVASVYKLKPPRPVTAAEIADLRGQLDRLLAQQGTN